MILSLQIVDIDGHEQLRIYEGFVFDIPDESLNPASETFTVIEITKLLEEYFSSEGKPESIDVFPHDVFSNRFFADWAKGHNIGLEIIGSHPHTEEANVHTPGQQMISALKALVEMLEAAIEDEPVTLTLNRVEAEILAKYLPIILKNLEKVNGTYYVLSENSRWALPFHEESVALLKSIVDKLRAKDVPRLGPGTGKPNIRSRNEK